MGKKAVSTDYEFNASSNVLTAIVEGQKPIEIDVGQLPENSRLHCLVYGLRASLGASKAAPAADAVKAGGDVAAAAYAAMRQRADHLLSGQLKAVREPGEKKIRVAFIVTDVMVQSIAEGLKKEPSKVRAALATKKADEIQRWLADKRVAPIFRRLSEGGEAPALNEADFE